MPSIEIVECTEPAELWCHYPHEGHPQPVYMTLDITSGQMTCGYDGLLGNAVPTEVHHGLVRRYRIPILTAEAANRIMREIAPLAQTVGNDSEEEWDGIRWVGTLGADAQEAEQKIEERLGEPADQFFDPESFYELSDLVSVWDEDSGFSGDEVQQFGITGNTTDDRLEEIEKAILSELAEVSPSGVVVFRNLSQHLKELRNALREDEEDD